MVMLMTKKAQSSRPPKPATIAFAKAITRGNDIVAQFALPGLLPTLVKDAFGHPLVYASMEDAEIEAHRALVVAMNSRLLDRRWRNGYLQASAGDFANALADAEITAGLFADLYGTTEGRVMMWLNGEADVPHSAYVMACMLRTDEGLAIAEQLFAERRTDP